jgi:guanylate kinase
MERQPELELSVSATTRAPRPGESDGVEYHFLTREGFDRRVAAGEFVEHADYAGRSYGTLRSELEARVRDGRPVVLEIEVQGARQVREAIPDAVAVFIAPPDEGALRERLTGRGTDSEAQIARRLATAREELSAQDEFRHVIVNDDLERAAGDLTALVTRALADAVQVFIAPPSLEALRTRLVGRGTDDSEEVERRLRVAEQELQAQPEFAHVVVNDRLDDALDQLAGIVAGKLD